MKKPVVAVVLAVCCAAPLLSSVSHAKQEPVVYTVLKGDTMWGLSDRFFRDPHYWPNLWGKNPEVTNPHFIFPGQKLKITQAGFEVVREDTTPASPAQTEAVPAQEAPPAKTFAVPGESFILEDGLKPAGRIIGIDQARNMVAEGDSVFTDIGRQKDAKPGDLYTVFQVLGKVPHPIRSFTTGTKVAAIGTIRLTQILADSSKAEVLATSQEVPKGSFLLPFKEAKRTVALSRVERALKGYILDTLKGNRMIGAGEIVYLDLGRKDGLKEGNMLYAVRNISLEGFTVKPKQVPVEVLGAMVVVDAGESSSTALVIKSSDAFYPGDRVEAAAE